MRRSRFVLGALASAGLGAAMACSFPDVTYEQSGIAPENDAAVESPPIQPDVDPNGSDTGTIQLDAAALEPIDVSGCTSCDCDGDGFEHLDPDGGCFGDPDGGPKGIDCDDTIRAIHPNQPEFIAETSWPPTSWQPQFDWDCDGKTSRQYDYDLDVKGCGLLCVGRGYGNNPACGESGDIVACNGLTGLLCGKPVAVSGVPQGCR